MMRTFAEHQHAVRELLAPLRAALDAPTGLEQLAVQSPGGSPALGRVLAVDVDSPADLPPFANSQMDGYAVRSADLAAARPEAPVALPVGGTTAAGDPVRALDPGTAAPVMTGAAVPVGADAVVPVEAADPPRFPDFGSDRAAPPGTVVGFTRPVDAGTFVRGAGTDVARGHRLLPAGIRLGPAQLGALSAAGITHVTVRRPLSVLLISTGHELRPPGEPLEPGQIHDANTAMLAAALREGGATVREVVTPDDARSVMAAVEASAGVVDLVVTTGGVSAGAFEVVREALAPLGVEFSKVALQPGGPQGLGLARVQPSLTPATASASDDASVAVPVVSFPGNPVSALVSFELFLRPVLRAFAGLAPDRPRARLRLAHEVVSPLDKHQVRRGVLDGAGDVEVGAPSSHLLHAYANATVLVHLPVGVDRLPAGAHVDIWRIDD
ncbi:molybdopterin molybdenumtransferase MoeA [Agromyces badenianii]|uniref:Molybdopterin molybdenumtransferase n=1 Tax=Agromyces badenianii TaxID=2080742 RepID=A0A2S0WXJ6_9MICO|nr:gephyrin-like molybdotransferase Glp [Agromyces badenianii]AWB96065.1 molybdopterin molybdenumtransferase MoeA [Agromyces badenianii]